MGRWLIYKWLVGYALIRGGGKILARQNESMYIMYEEYKKTLRKAKKVLLKRQNINRGIRDKYEEPHQRPDHVANVSDITNWNSMIRDLEEDMKMMEMYLDFDDRILLHRDYNNMKSMILNQNSYEGEIPLDTLYDECVGGVEDIICDIEFQEEIVDLLDKVLTERQKQVVNLYYFEGKTQEQIGKLLGVTQQAVTKILTNAIETLRKYVKSSDLLDF